MFWFFFSTEQNVVNIHCKYLYLFNFYYFCIFFVYQACKNGLVQHLEHLLFYGAEINARTASGNTALHVAALNNQVGGYHNSNYCLWQFKCPSWAAWSSYLLRPTFTRTYKSYMPIIIMQCSRDKVLSWFVLWLLSYTVTMLFKQAVIVLKLYGCTRAYVSSCCLKSGSVSLLLLTIIRETLRLAMEKPNSLELALLANISFLVFFLSF